MTTVTTAPLIDVLIPVFNGETWLRQAIGSIQSQTHQALCIHVVDDGSTDGTAAILAELAASDGRVAVHTKANGGIVDALNHGLQFCQSAWVARHDADDIARPTRLQVQLDYLTMHTDCVAVSAKARHIDSHGAPIGSFTEVRPTEQADARWIPAREPYLMHPLLMVRRDALAAVGGYRPVTHAEDSDLYWRLRERGRLHNLPEVLADYRLHGNSVSSQSIHGGRLMAVGSQLAALSSLRRRAGRADIPFETLRGAGLRSATSLRAMVKTASAELKPAEWPVFELASVAKLLELASYQPYELDPDDCSFIRATVSRHRAFEMQPGNRRELSGRLVRAAVRLFLKGRRQHAMLLLSARLWPAFVMRLALRVAVPTSWRGRLHALVKRASRTVRA